MATIGDAAVQLADDGWKVVPAKPGGKFPVVENWAEVATNDPMVVAEMWSRSRSSNISIPTGSVNGVVVIDLDTPNAIAWWESLGIEPGLRVDTPSGGRHYYYAIDPELDIQTNRSKLYAGVDVRAEGGQVIAPGSRTYNGAYVAETDFRLARVPDAPQELLDLLPERQAYEQVDLSDYENVDPIEEATEQERSELAWVRDTLEELPRPWREGAGWRETAFRMSCWLWRMVRSPFYAINEDQAASLILTHTPVDDHWGEDKVLAQWLDAEKRTYGQVARPPVEARPALLEWNDFPLDKEFPSIDGEAFASVWNALPSKTSEGALWAHRQKLAIALLKAGHPDALVATMVWHAKATKLPGISFGSHFVVDSDSRYIDIGELWREVDQAKQKIAEGGTEEFEAAPASERPSSRKKSYELLSGPERVKVSEFDWWGSRFMSWAEATFSLANQPYFRMNRWTILSVILSPHAKLPGAGGNDRSLNLYQVILGETTSGKTEALRSVKKALAKYYGDESTADVGGNFTPASLVETLIERDGQSSWMHIDEAHTKIAEWKKPTGPFSEMPGVITDVFDGDVSAIYRATKKDISGKHAKAFLTAHFMGTPQGMTDVMEPGDWESGFLNRFLWTIGDPPKRSAKAMVGSWVPETEVHEESAADDPSSKTYQQWAGEFALAVRKSARAGDGYTRMRIPVDVINRHEKFADRLIEIADESQYSDRLRPTFQRFQESIMRCAALVALIECSSRIEPIHHLVAIEQAEEWLRNMLIMVEATDESVRTRHVNLIEKTIAQSGGHMSMAAINRLPAFKNQRRYVLDLVGELEAQGRAEIRPTNGVSQVVIKGAYDA